MTTISLGILGIYMSSFWGFTIPLRTGSSPWKLPTPIPYFLKSGFYFSLLYLFLIIPPLFPVTAFSIVWNLMQFSSHWTRPHHILYLFPEQTQCPVERVRVYSSNTLYLPWNIELRSEGNKARCLGFYGSIPNEKYQQVLPLWKMAKSHLCFCRGYSVSNDSWVWITKHQFRAGVDSQ